MQVFLESLDYKSHTKIIAYIDKLIELLNIDPFPNKKISKFLKDRIFKLRVNLRNKTSRSLYFFEENKMIVFTHGFIKKTDKTPAKEFEKAKIIRDYWRKHNE